MKQKKILLKLLSLLPLGMLMICHSASPQTIETLFTTPDQRAYLDSLREEYLNRNAETSFDINQAFYSFNDIPEKKTEESSPSIIHYNLSAIITHSGGDRTIWLNNTSFNENELPANMSLIDSSPGLALQINTRNGEYLLKPGQSLNTETGLLLEASGE